MCFTGKGVRQSGNITAFGEKHHKKKRISFDNKKKWVTTKNIRNIFEVNVRLHAYEKKNSTLYYIPNSALHMKELHGKVN